MEYSNLPMGKIKSLAEELSLFKEGEKLLLALSEDAYDKSQIDLGGILYEYSIISRKHASSTKDFYERVSTVPKKYNENILWNKKENVQKEVQLNIGLSHYPLESLYLIYKNIYKNIWQDIYYNEENQLMLQHNKDNIWKIRDYCISKTNIMFSKLKEKPVAMLEHLDQCYYEGTLKEVVSVEESSNEYVKIRFKGQLVQLEMNSKTPVLYLAK